MTRLSLLGLLTVTYLFAIARSQEDASARQQPHGNAVKDASRGLRAPAPPSPATGAWQALPDMAVPRWEAGSVVFEDKLYVFGGYKMPTKACHRADAFDPKDNRWHKLADLPSAVTHLNMVLDGRSVWFAGGFKDGYKGHAIAEVWRYDIDKDTYTAGPSLPQPRASGGLAIVGRTLHFVGGLTKDRDTCSATHWVLGLKQLDSGNAKWKVAKPMSKGRCHFGTVTLDGKIYLIGGMYHHDSKQIDLPLVDIYDPETDSWSRGEDLPTGHTHAEAATFVHNNRIYFLGGVACVGERRWIDNKITVLSPKGKWESYRGGCRLVLQVSSMASFISRAAPRTAPRPNPAYGCGPRLEHSRCSLREDNGRFAERTTTITDTSNRRASEMDTKKVGANAMAAAIAVVVVAIGSPGQAHAQRFQAVGNTDPNHRAPPRYRGEVVVGFDSMPTKVSFDLPCFVCLVTENGIRYTNGATETYIEGFKEGESYEVWNDTQNVYSRFWIESQNDARIVVRHRNALVNHGRIAHAGQRKVSPYGPGEWTDEWYIFEPDGTHIRKVRVYTPNAERSTTCMRGLKFEQFVNKSGGMPEYSYHEMEGMYLVGGRPGVTVEDELEKTGITLVKMDGTYRDISFDPYPIKRYDAPAQERNRQQWEA